MVASTGHGSAQELRTAPALFTQTLIRYGGIAYWVLYLTTKRRGTLGAVRQAVLQTRDDNGPTVPERRALQCLYRLFRMRNWGEK